MESVTDQTVAPERPSWVRMIVVGRNPRLTLVRVVVLVVGCVIAFKYCLLPIRVDGSSMMPTYTEGRVNFINRLAFLWREPRRGEVVAVRYTGKSIMLLKRIIALPGETVEFVNGRAVVNGRPLDEPYLKFECDWTVRPERFQLGDDEYYVVGDNRTMPYEDHMQGAARRERILGRILL